MKRATGVLEKGKDWFQTKCTASNFRYSLFTQFPLLWPHFKCCTTEGIKIKIFKRKWFRHNYDIGLGRGEDLKLPPKPATLYFNETATLSLHQSEWPKRSEDLNLSWLESLLPNGRKKTLWLIKDHLKPKHLQCFFLTDEELEVGRGLDWQCWASNKLFPFLLIWMDACNTFSPLIAWDISTLNIPGYLFQRSIVWREEKRFWRVCHTRLWLLFLDDSLQVSFETHSKDLHFSNEKHFNCWL